jgi:mannosyl-3-phosphoglycerate phosphatase family protein
MKPQLVIFTDLDGTLLDLETYSFQPAVAVVHCLIARNIPLIFCSSKTRREQEFYQQQLGLRAPMIVENGAAIVIPADYFQRELPSQVEAEAQVIELGVPVSFIRQELQRIKREVKLNVTGFADLSLAELCAWTGLDAEAARRAQQRDYSETLVGAMTEDKVTALTESLQAQGLACTRGSRFSTVTSAQSDKGKAVQWLSEMFRQKFGAICTIGLGDSHNDLPMLRAVDRAFLLQEPSGSTLSHSANVQIVTGTGSAVWAAQINRLLDEQQ